MAQIMLIWYLQFPSKREKKKKKKITIFGHIKHFWTKN